MTCPHCGAQLPTTARFCGNCGQPLPDVPDHDVPRGPDAPDTPSTPGEPVIGDRRRSTKIAFLAVSVIAAITLSLGIFACLYRQAQTDAGAHVQHDVTFVIQADDLDRRSSRIPVRISGTDIDGNAVDMTTYLAREGVDTQLVNGNYTIEVLGSPISRSGVIFQTPAEPVEFTVEDLAADEGYVLPSELALGFEPLEEATKEQVDAALEFAQDDPEGNDVEGLRKAAYERYGIEQ